MQRPQREITLNDILITEELAQRSPRPPNLQAENQAMQTLAQQMVNAPEVMLQTLVDIAMQLCQAGTTGISLLETIDGEEVFRWNVLSGTLAQHVGGTTPRNFSPCGTCLDRGTLQLFAHPERYFTYLQSANTTVVEGLVLPLIADNCALGTIWIMSHDEQRHFDSEDVRVLTSLADFTTAALLLDRRQTRELLAANAALEAEIALRLQVEEKLHFAQRRLELSLKGANLGVWTYNVATDEFWADDRAKRMHGHADREVHNFEESGANIHPEDRDRAKAAFAQAMQNCSKMQIEYRAIWRDGSICWIASYAEFITSGDRDRGMFYGVVQDITETKREEAERKQAEQALRESEQRSRALIENLPVGAMFAVDRDLRYLLAEGEALSMAGFKPEDFVGQTIFEVLPLELATHYERLYRQALAGEPFEQEHSAHDRTFISRGTPLRNADGEIYAVLAVSYDISDRKQAEVALAYSRRQFEKIAATTPDLVYVFDLALERNLYVNEGIYRVLGYSQAQIATLGSSLIGSLIHPDDIPGVIEGNQRFQDLDDWQVYDHEIRMRHASGEYRWLRCRDTVFERTADGRVTQIIGIAQDITEQKQAEVALRASAAKYRSLFDSIDEGFCIFELIYDENEKAVDYRFVEVNQVFERQTGLQNAAGKLGSEIVPNTERYWLDVYDQVAQTGEPQRIENYNQSTGRWYGAYASRIGGAGSLQVCTVFEDISDRKRTEANLAFLAEVSQDLVHLTNIDETMDAIGAKIGGHFNVARVIFSEISEDQETGRVSHEWHQPNLPDMKGVYATKDYFSSEFERLHRAGEIAVVHNTATDQRVDGERYAALGIGTFVGVPLIRQDKWRFYFSLLDCEPRNWCDDEIELMRELTTRIWTRLERARAEAALRESEEKYRSLFESMDEGYLLSEVIFDKNGEPIDILYLEANPAAVRLAGRDFSGQRMREIDPNYEEYWYEIYGRVALTGESVRAERYAEPHDRWFDFYAFKVGGQESRRVASIFQDITERKLYERQQAFLLKFSDALRGEPDADSVANRAVRMLAEHLHLDRVWLSEVFEQQDISRIGSEYHRSDLSPMSGVYRLSDYPETMRQLATQPMVIHDVSSDPDFSDSEKALLSQLQIRALLVVSLRKGQHQVIWALASTVTTPRHWNESERVLLEQVSERTWAAIERARAEAVVEADLRDTQMLHALATRLIVEEDIQTLYQEIVKTAIALTQADAGSFQILDETTQELVLIATVGINRTMAEHFYRLDASSNTSCGIALTTGKRTFINFDVPQSEDPDGSLRMHKDAGFLCVQSTPLISRSGKPIGMVSTHWREDRRLSARELRFLDLLARQAADIIEQRQAEENRIQLIHEQAAREEERQRAESLAELDRAKTLFFSNISHEFRTPLTLSLAPLQDALSDRAHSLDSVTRERLELVYRNNLRLLKLVNTLLDFSRIEAGRIEAVYEPTDLSAFTTELASVFRSAIERVGLQLIVDCSPLPEPVFVDREMWEKIVLNLLSNAFKFTFKGEIRVSLHPCHGSIAILQVQDTGTGVAPEHLPHLFERFYQVRGIQARTLEGSGIGLALVYELVRLQGGTIEVSSTLAEGTCFTVSLPFGTDHLPSDRLGDRQLTRTLASTAMGANSYVEEAERWLPIEENREQTTGDIDKQTADFELSTLASARVLLVDDNADMREYLTRILGDRVQVEAVADGATALAVATERLPDLILSDVMMPGLDGFELLHALRANPRTKEVPIVLLSARAGEEAIVEGLEAGADDYLIKPFSAQELVSRVTAHLQMAQLRTKALEQERMVNHQKDEFISIVSHELNTPLVSILGWTRILRTNPPNLATLSKALDTIERNATLQAKLVQDLLDISRIEAGKLRLHSQPIELASVIETAIAAVAPIAADKGIDLTLPENVTELVVMGDSDRLSQVLINLLSNAIKFTPESGSVTLEVSFTSSARSADMSYAEIRVADTGIGITADFLPYVFDRFRQAESTKSVKGLGLGLAIARHIVELHNGIIRAESAGEGQGATIIVRLPILEAMPSDRP